MPLRISCRGMCLAAILGIVMISCVSSTRPFADPFAILNISSQATPDDVRKAFRTAARRVHPDLNPNDPSAHQRMSQINMAYEAIWKIFERGESQQGDHQSDEEDDENVYGSCDREDGCEISGFILYGTRFSEHFRQAYNADLEEEEIPHDTNRRRNFRLPIIHEFSASNNRMSLRNRRRSALERTPEAQMLEQLSEIIVSEFPAANDCQKLWNTSTSRLQQEVAGWLTTFQANPAKAEQSFDLLLSSFRCRDQPSFAVCISAHALHQHLHISGIPAKLIVSERSGDLEWQVLREFEQHIFGEEAAPQTAELHDAILSILLTKTRRDDTNETELALLESVITFGLQQGGHSFEHMFASLANAAMMQSDDRSAHIGSIMRAASFVLQGNFFSASELLARTLSVAVDNLILRMVSAVLTSDRYEQLAQNELPGSGAAVHDIRIFTEKTIPRSILEHQVFAQNHLNLRAVSEFKALIAYERVARKWAGELRQRCSFLNKHDIGEEAASEPMTVEACLATVAEVSFLVLDELDGGGGGTKLFTAVASRAAVYLMQQLEALRNFSSCSGRRTSNEDDDDGQVVSVLARHHEFAIEKLAFRIAQSAWAHESDGSPLQRAVTIESFLYVASHVELFDMNPMQIALALEELRFTASAAPVIGMQRGLLSTTDLFTAQIFESKLPSMMANSIVGPVAEYRAGALDYHAYIGEVYGWGPAQADELNGTTSSTGQQRQIHEEDTLRADGVMKLRSISSSLAEENATVEGLQASLEWSMLRRDINGYRATGRTTLMFAEGNEAFRSIDGARVNSVTGEVSFVFSAAREGESSLISEADVVELVSNGGSNGMLFSLDAHSTEQRHSPLQRQRIIPKQLTDSQLHRTALHADLLLKYLSIGVELSAKVPFQSRPISALLDALPAHVAQDLLPVHKRRPEKPPLNMSSVLDRNHEASRFWIEARNVSWSAKYVDGERNVVEYQVGQCDMRVLTQKLMLSDDGSSADAPEASQNDQSEESSFARNMTLHYDRLGEYFPDLLRLRELNKLMTLIRLVKGYSLSMISDDREEAEALRETRASVKYPRASDPAEVQDSIDELVALNTFITPANRHMYDAKLRQMAVDSLVSADTKFVILARESFGKSIDETEHPQLNSAVDDWLRHQPEPLARLIALGKNRRREKIASSLARLDIHAHGERGKPFLQDGDVYEIAPRHDPSLRLDVCGGKNSNGVHLHLWEINSQRSQRFLVKQKQGTNTYSFIPSCAETRSIDHSGAPLQPCHLWSTEDGNNINQWWSLEPSGDGYFVVRSRAAPHAVWDIAGHGGQGAELKTSREHRGENQQFHFITTVEKAQQHSALDADKRRFAPSAVDRSHRRIIVYGGVHLGGQGQKVPVGDAWTDSAHGTTRQRSVSSDHMGNARQPETHSPQPQEHQRPTPKAGHVPNAQKPQPSVDSLARDSKYSDLVYAARKGSSTPGTYSHDRVQHHLHKVAPDVEVARDRQTGKHLSNQDFVVIHDKARNEYVIAHSGTRLGPDLTMLRDLKADGNIALKAQQVHTAEMLASMAEHIRPFSSTAGNALHSMAQDNGRLADQESLSWKRVQEAIRVTNEVKLMAASTGATVRQTGHSLGGHVASVVGAATATSATTFNAPLPFDSHTTTAVRSEGDLFWMAGSHGTAAHVIEVPVDGHAIGPLSDYLHEQAKKPSR